MGKRLNLRAAVLHVNSAGATATSPTMRIARFAAQELGVPLVHNVETADALCKDIRKNGGLDALFVKFGMLKFSDHREQALDIYHAAKHVVNLENDITFRTDSRFLKINPVIERWSTIVLGGEDERYVNWNVLTWRNPDDWAVPFAWPEVTHRRLFYYGAYKENRAVYFKKYLARAPYGVTVSSYKGGPKFSELCPSIETIGPIRDPAFPGRYAATLYIEDENLHSTFQSPANRFYESLQLGVTQIFDVNTYRMMKEAGYDITPFVVGSKKDVVRLLPQWGRIREHQRRMWYRDFTHDLRYQLRSAARASFGARCGV